MSAYENNNTTTSNNPTNTAGGGSGSAINNNSTGNPLLYSSSSLVTDLEQEVLDEYARLLENVNKLSAALADLAGSPASLTLDGLRLLERQTATVYTLLKASVYSIVLQQQIINEGEGGDIVGRTPADAASDTANVSAHLGDDGDDD